MQLQINIRFLNWYYICSNKKLSFEDCIIPHFANLCASKMKLTTYIRCDIILLKKVVEKAVHYFAFALGKGAVF